MVHQLVKEISQPTTGWRFPRLAFFVAIIGLAGLLVLLYPSTAAWVTQYQQSQVIIQSHTNLASVTGDERQHQLELARNYNANLTSGAIFEANMNIASGTGSATSSIPYEELLLGDASGAMGRIKIPAINVDLPIYHGTDDATLEHGVGHLEGTSLPVGGVSQRSVLTAHRGLASSELFTNLDQVSVGDTFTVEVFGEVLTYQVTETVVIDPDQTEVLFPEFDRDLMSLITCTPLGINTHRILVTGERVTPTPIEDITAAGIAPEIPGFPWWIVGLGTGLTVLTGYVWLMGRPHEFHTHKPEWARSPVAPLRQ